MASPIPVEAARFASLDRSDEKERDPSDLDRRVSSLRVRGPGENCSVLIGDRKVVIIPLDSPILKGSYFKEMHKYFVDEKAPGFVRIPDCFDKSLIEQVLLNQQDFRYLNKTNVLEAIQIGDCFSFGALIAACDEILAAQITDHPSENNLLDKAPSLMQLKSLPETVEALKKGPTNKERSLGVKIVTAARNDEETPGKNELRNYIKSLTAGGTKIVHLDLIDCYHTRTISTSSHGAFNQWGASLGSSEYSYKVSWITDKLLTELLTALPDLESLNLEGCDVLTAAIALKILQLKNLRLLKIDASVMKFIGRDLHKMSKLRILRLVECNLSIYFKNDLTSSRPYFRIYQDKRDEGEWGCTIA